ncbi:MAG TPA: methyl-accepting chemotaxis protein [Burkholderiaceae bacterium]|nr:methyl-accepting chemotaxis protein [Burkholderiaceae bacterium]
MNFLLRLSIGSRLAVGFAFVLGIACVLVALAVQRLSLLSGSVELIRTDRLPKVERVVTVVDQVNLVARELRNVLIFDDPQWLERSTRSIEAARLKAGQELEELDKRITTADGRRLMEEVKQARSVFTAMQDRLLTAVREGRRAEAVQLLESELRPVQLKYMEALGRVKTYQFELVEQASTEARDVQRRSLVVMSAALGVAVLVGGGFCWWVARSVTRPLAEGVAVAGRIAQGDLSRPVPAAGQDEVGRLMKALAAMQDNLRDLVGQVRSSTDSISTASSQIASGNTDLSSRTEQAASSLQQTAASMEQLTATVQQSADTARSAEQVAAQAVQAARHGGQAVGAVVETMDGIRSSAQRIGEIIAVIDGIAFQTNILALNAAVEAARAGEQGRGFAVVAGEVRSLAQRCADAAREIRELIITSGERVDAGVTLVQDAGRAMEGIVASIERVSALITQLTAASREQSEGISQINQAVGQLDQVTQQNAALVEESAAAASSLRDQAEGLIRTVSVFRLAAV